MSWLPKDIIIHDIFPKLPIKSLLRFKCVSKSFNSLISSPEFIQLHLRQTRSSNTNRLLILAGADNQNLYSIDLYSLDSVTTIPLPCTPDKSKPREVSIVGSFNGLICVGLGVDRGFFSMFKHVLINPCTRVFREIPYNCTPKGSFLVSIRFTFGFGFDDLNGDYKLVRVTVFTELDDSNLPFGRFVRYREVIVYSLNQNTWKFVERVKDPIDLLTKTQNGVLIKNHLLHWVFSDSNNYRIGCFDTRSDKWARDVPLTDELFEENTNKFRVGSLLVINGCLCLSTTATNTSKEVLWMLKDYDEANESWVKLYHITPYLSSRLFQFRQPFLSLRRESNYEVLVPNLNRKGIFWYNVGPITYGRKEKITRIPRFVEGCFYTGSLVQIPGGRHLRQDKLNDLFYRYF